MQSNSKEKKPSEASKKSKPKEFSAGEILKKTREEQGLSLESVHESTKIPMDVLRAIEEGYTVRILTPFYLKGFLKIYATFLGVEVSHVVKESKKESLPKPVDGYVDDFEIQEWFSRIFTRERIQQITFGLGVLFALFLLFKGIVFLVNRPPKPEKKVTASVVKKEIKEAPKAKLEAKAVENEKPKPPPEVVPKGAPKPQPPKPAPVAAPVAPPVQVSQAVQKDVILTVRAARRSWLRVTVDGQVVFQSALREGAVETWRADKEIIISGSNIHNLEFELNSKLIGSLGRKDSKAKEVVITKDGLNVSK